MLDLSLALLALPLLLLVTLVVLVAVKVDDRGPVFHISRRLGKHGKPFRMIKFRTMKVGARDFRNADGSSYNARNDSRVTRFGRILRATSADELPQALNVVMGHMSFIGPRPDLPDALDLYTDSERKKLMVRPGITGYSQAFWRNEVSQEQKFQNDVAYVEGASARFDFNILVRTVTRVFSRRGIYNPTGAENDRFEQ